MNSDPFEHHLSRQPLRPVPAAWRDEMLASASAPQSPPSPSQPSTLISQLQSWLWPCPQAWAALAAVWVVLLAMNFADDSRSSRTSQTASHPISPAELHYAWREQQKLLAELFPPEPVAPLRPHVQPVPAPAAAPRSDVRPVCRREEEIA